MDKHIEDRLPTQIFMEARQVMCLSKPGKVATLGIVTTQLPLIKIIQRFGPIVANFSRAAKCLVYMINPLT